MARASPAARLGLRTGHIPISIDGQNVILGGDVILMVNDVRIDSPESIRDIRNALRSFEVGQPLLVEILRAGRKEHLEMTPYTVDNSYTSRL